MLFIFAWFCPCFWRSLFTITKDNNILKKTRSLERTAFVHSSMQRRNKTLWVLWNCLDTWKLLLVIFEKIKQNQKKNRNIQPGPEKQCSCKKKECKMQAVWFHLKCFIFFLFIRLAVAQLLTENWYLHCQWKWNRDAGRRLYWNSRVHCWEFVL